jgi:hypothetical protein
MKRKPESADPPTVLNTLPLDRLFDSQFDSLAGGRNVAVL